MLRNGNMCFMTTGRRNFQDFDVEQSWFSLNDYLAQQAMSRDLTTQFFQVRSNDRKYTARVERFLTTSLPATGVTARWFRRREIL